MKKERLNAADYGYLSLIVVIFIAFSWLYNINQLFSFDQIQMLYKGFYAYFNGEYLPFGNEASVLGNLPGPASSWVIGFPMELYAHPYSPFVFQLALRVISIFVFANALSLLFARNIVVVGTFLFALSPWLLYQTMLYNPAYLSLGAAVALNCIVRMRRTEQENRRHSDNPVGRFFASFILVLAVGFCLELHFSWPVLAAAIGIMWLRRDIKISYVGVLVGLALLAWNLWPYVQYVMNYPSIMKSDAGDTSRYIGYGFTHVYPVLKGILYWFRFASLLVTKKAIVPELEDDYSIVLVVLWYGWVGITHLLGGITVLLAAYSNYFVVAKFHSVTSTDKLRFVRGLTISSLLAVIIASGLSPITLNFWQIAVIIPFALIPLLAYLSVRQNLVKLYVVVSAVFFLLANGLGATYSEKFNYRYNYHAEFYINCLYGFTQKQCEVFAQGLDAKNKKIIDEHVEPSQAIRDRILYYKFNDNGEGNWIYDGAVHNLIPNSEGLIEFTTPKITGAKNKAPWFAAPVTANNKQDETKAESKDKEEPKDNAKADEKAKADTKADAKVEPKAKDDAKADAKADPKAKSDAKADPKAKADVKAESQEKAAPKAEVKAKTEVKEEPKVKAEPKTQPKAQVKEEVKAESAVKATPKTEPKAAAKDKQEAKVEAKPQVQVKVVAVKTEVKTDAPKVEAKAAPQAKKAESAVAEKPKQEVKVIHNSDGLTGEIVLN